MSLFTPGERPEQVSPEVWDFARERSVDVTDDLLCNPEWTPFLVQSRGKSEHFVRKQDVEYMSARIDYRQDSVVRACRIITTILAGKRTEIAYWHEDAPDRLATIHKGMGTLILGVPERHVATQVPLNEYYSSSVSLTGGQVYTFEASPGRLPLIVSELWENPNAGMIRYRTFCLPGQEEIWTPDGVIDIPQGFPEAPYK